MTVNNKQVAIVVAAIAVPVVVVATELSAWLRLAAAATAAVAGV